MYSFAAFGPLQYVGIALAGVFLTVFFLFFLLREQKSIKAVDGTLFSSEEACRSYEIVLERVNALFKEREKNSSIEPFDLQMGFTKLLTKEGFVDAKTLIKYRYDFEKLVKLFNVDS